MLEYISMPFVGREELYYELRTIGQHIYTCHLVQYEDPRLHPTEPPTLIFMAQRSESTGEILNCGRWLMIAESETLSPRAEFTRRAIRAFDTFIEDMK